MSVRSVLASNGAIYAATVFCLTACSGGSGAPATGRPPPIVVTRSFPAGDAVAAGGGSAWDIVGVTTTLSGLFSGGNVYDNLRVDVSFAQRVSGALPAAGRALLAPTQLGLSIRLYKDGTSAPGSFTGCSGRGTAFVFGSEATSRLTDGNYTIFGNKGAIYDGPSYPPAEARTEASDTTISRSFIYRPSTLPPVRSCRTSISTSSQLTEPTLLHA